MSAMNVKFGRLRAGGLVGLEFELGANPKPPGGAKPDLAGAAKGDDVGADGAGDGDAGGDAVGGADDDDDFAEGELGLAGDGVRGDVGLRIVG